MFHKIKVKYHFHKSNFTISASDRLKLNNPIDSLDKTNLCLKFQVLPPSYYCRRKQKVIIRRIIRELDLPELHKCQERNYFYTSKFNSTIQGCFLVKVMVFHTHVLVRDELNILVFKLFSFVTAKEIYEEKIKSVT